MVEFVMPLPVSEQYEEENCNQYLNTKRIQLQGLTEEKCTRNGYLKIILFHYFYTLYYLFMRPENLSFSTSHIDAIEDKLILPTIPSWIDNENIKYVMRRVNHVKNTLGIEWKKIVIFAKKEMFSFIEKVTDLGFYVAINLIDDRKVGKHVNHSVVCIGTYDDKLLIKNSWGDEEVHEIEMGEKLQLNEYSFGVSYGLFYLPCRSLPIERVFTPEERKIFREWLDNYISEFPEMVAPIPAILASTPDEIEPKSMPTFEIGDSVHIKDVGRGKIVSKVGNDFEVFYTDEKGIEKERQFSSRELTKGGKSRRRTRKRIR